MASIYIPLVYSHLLRCERWIFSVSSWMFVFCVTEDAARHNPDQPPGPHPRGLSPGLQLSCWWPRGAFIWPCLHSSPRASLRHHHRPPRHPPGRDSHEDAAQEPRLLYCKLIQRNEHTAHWALVRLPLAELFLLSFLINPHHSVFCSRKATNGTLTSKTKLKLLGWNNFFFNSIHFYY